jgi:hypothetical protein
MSCLAMKKRSNSTMWKLELGSGLKLSSIEFLINLFLNQFKYNICNIYELYKAEKFKETINFYLYK